MREKHVETCTYFIFVSINMKGWAIMLVDESRHYKAQVH